MMKKKPQRFRLFSNQFSRKEEKGVNIVLSINFLNNNKNMEMVIKRIII